MTDEAAYEMVRQIFLVILGGWAVAYGSIMIVDFFTDVSR